MDNQQEMKEMAIRLIRGQGRLEKITETPILDISKEANPIVIQFVITGTRVIYADESPTLLQPPSVS